MKVSVLGCGWLGLPLAKMLLDKGYKVKGSTTNPEKIDTLKKLGVQPYLVAFDPEPLYELKDFFDADILFINIPPRSRSKSPDYHQAQVKHIISHFTSGISKVIYVSSTSVYPKDEGHYTEDAFLDEEVTGNLALLRSEKMIGIVQVQNRIILRSAGQMGLERIPGKYFSGKTIKNAFDRVNYVHFEDLVEVSCRSVTDQLASGIYNVVADQHPLKKDVVMASIEDMGLEPADVDNSDPYRTRVIVGEKIKNALNYEYKYPDPIDFKY